MSKQMICAECGASFSAKTPNWVEVGHQGKKETTKLCSIGCRDAFMAKNFPGYRITGATTIDTKKGN